MRKKVIAGNWKMNMVPSQVLEFIRTFDGKFKNDREVIFCVPFVSLQGVILACKGTNIAVGAQNLHEEESGAYTGEISAGMLSDMGVKYVIVGHSERRQYFSETDELVNKKVQAALKQGLTPIICVGEVLKERKQNVTIEVVRKQVKISLQNVSMQQARGIIIAYEPVWAIGTGETATNDQAEEVCRSIRDLLKEIYNNEIANEIIIQYGGSVNSKNAKDLFEMPNIDGGLVGGASLKEEFIDVVNA